MDTQILFDLYTRTTGTRPSAVDALPGAGSNRHYFRLHGVRTMIGVFGECTEENQAFIGMASHFRAQGLSVPEVYAVSADRQYYLQEDLGSTPLFDCIADGRATGHFSDDEILLLTRTIRQLPSIQFRGGKDFDYSMCYPMAEFNRRSILWDLNYFKYCFLKTTGLEFSEELLENDFERLTDYLIESFSTPTFMYRDFQSRNVMIKDGHPYFIDFQGGRRGPIYYDVAAFLWQAKANLPKSLRFRLIDEYIDALREFMPQVDRNEFLTRLRHFVLFRTMQVLGAYGFRGYFERKPHFIQSVPFAIENLHELLKEDFTDYPYMNEMLHRLTQMKQFAPTLNRHKLTVTVMSFSYRKGIPEDTSGNGGGYVFDCRHVHNPGRYDQYKQLTGMDLPVIQFLEEDGEITTFLQSVNALVDAHVQRYLERGFSNLMVCFGCTGGQHRSVYSAQHVAEHVHRKFGVRVHLIHREQNVDNFLE